MIACIKKAFSKSRLFLLQLGAGDPTLLGPQNGALTPEESIFVGEQLT
jgi:hypothetical protein